MVAVVFISGNEKLAAQIYLADVESYLLAKVTSLNSQVGQNWQKLPE